MSSFDNTNFLLSLLAKHPDQAKYIPRWLMSLSKDYLLNKQLPWVTFYALDFLNTLDFKGKRVFEYGSGASTLYWLSKGASCVSIEHEKRWYDKMNSSFAAIAEVDYRLIEPELRSPGETTMNPANPDNYASNSPEFKNYAFSHYVQQIDEFPDEYFDVVMVDGRARPSCIKRSLSKVRVGGFIIVDNTDRDYYLRETIDSLKNFSRQEFFGLVPVVTCISKTDFFTRLK
jgi:hypothetical protein